MCLTRRWEVREFSPKGRKPYFVRCALPYKNEKRTSPGKAPGERPNKKGTNPQVGVRDLKDSTGSLLEGLCVVLREHRASLRVQNALLEQVHLYLDCSPSEGIWVKKAKYLLSYPRAKYLKNELPPIPEGGDFRPTGPLRGWMKPRLNAFSPRNSHLWSSWQEAKRCCSPVSEEFVEKIYQEHFDKLSSPDPLEGKDEFLDEIMDNPHFDHLLTKMSRYVSSGFDRLRNFTEYTPTQSACFEKLRGEGGQAEALKEEAKIPIWCGLAIPSLREMRFIPRFLTTSGYTTRVVPIYGNPFRSSWDLLPSYRESTTLDCEIRGVLEPLKVRVISKGNALAYYNFKALQRRMHDFLREIPCFRLIGRELCAADLIDIYRPEKSHWFSVDYSAATDSLSGKYGIRILRKILELCPDDYKKGAEAVLGNHNLWYPVRAQKGSTEPLEPRVKRGVQVNGQLMGSILSFPILCLANLGLFLHLDESHTPNDVLVNGDDMLYCADLPLWKKHVEEGEAIGLRMSVGKAYYHDTYCNINSTSFHYSLNGGSLPREIPFLNTGLLFGRHKVQGEDSRELVLDEWQSNLLAANHHSTQYTGVVANLNEILQGCFNDESRIRILNEVIRTNSESIRAETTAFYYLHGYRKFFRKNLFLSCSIGGMGVVKPNGYKNKISKIQRIVAHNLILEKMKYGSVAFQRPVPGYEIKELPRSIDPWQVAPDLEVPRVYRLSEAYEARGIERISDLILFDPSPSTIC